MAVVISILLGAIGGSNCFFSVFLKRKKTTTKNT